MLTSSLPMFKPNMEEKQIPLRTVYMKEYNNSMSFPIQNVVKEIE